MIKIIAAILAGYLIGSIPFGHIFAKSKGIDIRRQGSGNIGATNVWRTMGRAYGIAVLLLDALKGAAAVIIGRLTGIDGVELLTALAALLGHAFPVYLGFRGGKIIAAGAGAMLTLAPLPCLIAILFFAIVVLITRYVSLGSVCGALSIPILLAVFDYSALYIAFGAFVCAFALYKHIPNLKRILAGTEAKIK